MAISTVRVKLDADVNRIWYIITSLENYAWRSDLSNIEVISETQFVEYTRSGHATTFTITATEPHKRWEFDMQNDNIQGHWIGKFTSLGDITEIEFSENVTAKKVFMRPFVRAYLKKQQAQYISDLRKALKV